MIIAVALKNKHTGLIATLPKPNRHNDVIHGLYYILGKQVSGDLWEQGFITDEGIFKDRHEAAKWVNLIGQKVTEQCKQDNEKTGLHTLFSEDLW